jgi:ribosomal protein L7/L12
MQLVVIVALLVLLWFVVTSALRGRSAGRVAFTPVAELSPSARTVIDEAIDRGELIPAIKHYRAETGAGLAAAKAAVETHRDTRG